MAPRRHFNPDRAMHNQFPSARGNRKREVRDVMQYRVFTEQKKSADLLIERGLPPASAYARFGSLSHLTKGA